MGVPLLHAEGGRGVNRCVHANHHQDTASRRKGKIPFAKGTNIFRISLFEFLSHSHLGSVAECPEWRGGRKLFCIWCINSRVSYSTTGFLEDRRPRFDHAILIGGSRPYL